MINSAGKKETLQDSIHAPAKSKKTSIINLPPQDLRHHLNKLRHFKESDRQYFATIPAQTISGSNRIDKINFIRNICQPISGFIDMNWMFYDIQAQIILELNDQQTFDYTKHLLTTITPQILLTVITDLRQLLNLTPQLTHHSRLDSPVYYDIKQSNLPTRVADFRTLMNISHSRN